MNRRPIWDGDKFIRAPDGESTLRQRIAELELKWLREAGDMRPSILESVTQPLGAAKAVLHSCARDLRAILDE